MVTCIARPLPFSGIQQEPLLKRPCLLAFLLIHHSEPWISSLFSIDSAMLMIDLIHSAFFLFFYVGLSLLIACHALFFFNCFVCHFPPFSIFPSANISLRLSLSYHVLYLHLPLPIHSLSCIHTPAISHSFDPQYFPF